MCCLFTCFGWMIDLIQRAWTFTMSCCISLAVCCSILTASVSGIALGYNYSLAEYIDLKETNVSVYLKRGVFDDDISDDTEWRRSGHLPVSGHIREDNLITGSSDDEVSTLRPGRRMDDSIFQSNEKNNFEDSLMRLTAKAPDYSSTEGVVTELPMGDIVMKYPSNDLEQLKAIKSAINMRRMEMAASRTAVGTEKTTYQDLRAIPNFPFSRPDGPLRRMPFDVPSMSPSSTINSLRDAVPADDINSPLKWMLPNLPKNSYLRAKYMRDDYDGLTFPTPITPRPGPVRPTRPQYIPQKTVHPPEPIRSTLSPRPDIPKSIDEEMDTFKEKFAVDQEGSTREKENDFLQNLKPGAKPDEDYEYDVKGVPMRKRRGILNMTEINTLAQSISKF